MTYAHNCLKIQLLYFVQSPNIYRNDSTIIVEAIKQNRTIAKRQTQSRTNGNNCIAKLKKPKQADKTYAIAATNNARIKYLIYLPKSRNSGLSGFAVIIKLFIRFR